MRLDVHLRRLTTYLYLQDSIAGQVLELGPRDGKSAGVLVEHGAERVVVIGRDAAAQAGDRVEVRAGDPSRTGLADASFDLALALDVAPGELDAVVAEARRVLKADGALVVGCESKDRPGAKSGVSYYDLVDRLEKRFKAVTMIGQAPFAGATLVEYGVKDPEPLLDGTLVDKGERVEFYVAIAGPEKRSGGGYAVVQVPVAHVAQHEPAAIAAPAPAPAPASATAPAAKSPPSADVTELRERLSTRERALDEAREAARLHALAMDGARAELKERDALIAELEREARGAESLREAARRAEERAAAAEAKERHARLELAQAQGRILGQNANPSGFTASAAAPPVSADARVAELEAENARLKTREEDARADAWKAMKARSEAEAAAAEVREDTVRKLKDARKLASVELMHAMEQATKKAVQLREELTRSEKERKDAVVELKAAREELEQLRAAQAQAAGAREMARAREEGDAAVLAVRAQAERTVHDEEAARAAAESAERAAAARIDTLHGRVVALERELREAELSLEQERERGAELLRRLEAETLEAQKQAAAGAAAHGAELESAHADRERLGRLLSDVERLARERAEAALRTRQSLKEREREVEALRHEVAARDAKLIAFERHHPPVAEVERMEAELSQSRARLAELSLELARSGAAVERAAQAASHERARAERLVAEERRALHDRNEARARVAEAEARAAGAALENERLALQRDAEAERARKAENESRERKERIKQLKRELEDAERRLEAEGARAAHVDDVRARLLEMETQLRGEEQRMAMMEEALRRAAAEAAQGGAPGVE